MARGVSTVQITIPGSVQRLKKQGYAASVLVRDIWPLTVPSSDAQNSTPNSGLPIVYLSRILDDIP